VILVGRAGDSRQLGEFVDGRGDYLPDLSNFLCEKYGIAIQL
jgi:hypothetical protein